MAKSLAQAQANWERKTANAGDRWKAGTSGKGGAYSDGVSAFLGVAPSQRVVSSWQGGVDAVSAGDFQGSISGKGSKWADRLRAGLTS